MSDEQHQKPHLRVVKAIDEALPAGGGPDDAVSGAAAAADPAPLNEKAGKGRSRRERASRAKPGGEGWHEKRARFGKDGVSHADLDLQLSRFQCTDLGNVRRFIARSGKDFLFVPEWGWLAWDGRRWNAQEADAILGRAIHDMVESIRREAAALEASPHDVLLETKANGREVWASDRVMGWYVASQSNSHVACIATLAKIYVTASADQFDRDPCAINVANGTLMVVKGGEAGYVSLHPHRREDMHTKLASVVYDPAAACPVYDGFLARVQPDPRMQRHLHAWGGLSLTALPVAKLSFWYGTGRNGKSTLVDAWAHVMGEYAQTIPIESFLDQGRSRRGGEASPDIASLPAVRALRTSEPERGSKLAEGLIKLVTGGEPMRARHLNRDFFEFRPCFKLTMQGNYKPRVDGTDEGLWARLLIVPWSVMIPEEERDATLPAKLKGEGSGILNRLLDGLCDYLDKGLTPPDEVLDATQEYREQSDPIGRFLRECCDQTDAKAKVEAKPLYALYAAWAKAEGEPVWSVKGFSRGLQEHGITRRKSDTIIYVGLALTRDKSEFEGMEIKDESEPKR